MSGLVLCLSLLRGGLGLQEFWRGPPPVRTQLIQQFFAEEVQVQILGSWPPSPPPSMAPPWSSWRTAADRSTAATWSAFLASSWAIVVALSRVWILKAFTAAGWKVLHSWPSSLSPGNGGLSPIGAFRKSSSNSMGQFLITARTEEGTKSEKLAWSGFSHAIGSVASSLTSTEALSLRSRARSVSGPSAPADRAAVQTALPWSSTVSCQCVPAISRWPSCSPCRWAPSSCHTPCTSWRPSSPRAWCNRGRSRMWVPYPGGGSPGPHIPGQRACQPAVPGC